MPGAAAQHNACYRNMDGVGRYGAAAQADGVGPLGARCKLPPLRGWACWAVAGWAVLRAVVVGGGRGWWVVGVRRGELWGDGALDGQERGEGGMQWDATT